MYRGFIALGVITGSTGVLNVFSIYVLTSAFGVEIYGSFAMVLAITTLTSNLTKFGLDTHIMKYCSPRVQDLGSVATLDYLRINKWTAICAAAAAFVSASCLVWVMFEAAGLAFGIAVGGAACALLLKILFAALIRSLGHPVLSQFFLRLSDVLLFVAALLSAIFLFDVSETDKAFLALIWAGSAVCGLCFCVAVYLWAVRTWAGPSPDANAAREQRDDPDFRARPRQLLYFSLVNSAAALIQTLDVLLIGAINGELSAGVFSILKRSVNQIYLVVGLFQIQYWRKLSVACFDRDLTDIHATLRKVRIAVMASLPLLCVAAAGIAYFLLRGSAGLSSGQIIGAFLLLMSAMVVNALFLFAATLANLSGLERSLFFSMVAGGGGMYAILLLGGGDVVVAAAAFLFYQIFVNSTVALRLWKSKQINMFG